MNRTISAFIIPVIPVIMIFLASCNNGQSDAAAGGGDKTADNAPPIINYTVIGSLPHDTSSYTEGLLMHDGQLFESTGTTPDMPVDHRSLFGTVDPKTGKINAKVELDRKKYFGEGIVFLNGKVYQLTYKTKTGFIYDEKTFKKLGEFTFPSAEGWALTTDGTHLIMSDGTSNIYYFDPNSTQPVEVKVVYEDGDSVVKTMNTFKLVKILGVTDNNGPVGDINELELINGYLYANRYTTNYILKIDTASGKVVGKLNLDSLANTAKNKFGGVDVLNGIAYDSATGKIYVTGKLWPDIYEIKFPI